MSQAFASVKKAAETYTGNRLLVERQLSAEILGALMQMEGEIDEMRHTVRTDEQAKYILDAHDRYWEDNFPSIEEKLKDFWGIKHPD